MRIRLPAGMALVGLLAVTGGVACTDEDGDGAGTDEELDQVDEELEDAGDEAEEELEEIEDEVDDEDGQ